MISLYKENVTHMMTPHDDALIVCIDIDKFDMQKLLVDGGSSTNILFLGAF